MDPSTIITTLSTMNVNQLDDDCLILLFRQFTTQQLIHLRAVCPRWQVIIEQNFFVSRRTLKLFSSFQCVYRYCNELVSYCAEGAQEYKLINNGQDDDLIVPLHSEEVCHLLVDLFPGVQQLVVYLNENDFAFLPILLDRMPGLTSLTIFGCMPHNKFDHQEALLRSINSLESLKSLHFFTPLSGEIRLPQVFFQLESFSLVGYQAAMVQILSQLGPNLKQLTLNPISFLQLRELFREDPNFGQNVTHLNADNQCRESLEFVCAHFPALKSLEVGLDEVKLIDIASSVQQLKHLTELRFKVFGVDQLKPDEGQPMPSLSQYQVLANIKQVHIFTLNVFSASLSGPNILCKTFATVFPNAEHIYVRNESPSALPAVLAGIKSDDLLPSELSYLERYKIYSSLDLNHAGRHKVKCKQEKRNRMLRMWDYDQQIQSRDDAHGYFQSW